MMDLEEMLDQWLAHEDQLLRQERELGEANLEQALERTRRLRAILSQRRKAVEKLFDQAVMEKATEMAKSVVAQAASQAAAEERAKIERKLARERAAPPKMDGTIRCRISLSMYGRQWCAEKVIDPIVVKHGREGGPRVLLRVVRAVADEAVVGFVSEHADESVFKRGF